MGKRQVDTLDYIQSRFSLNLDQRRMPIEIQNFGRAPLAYLFHDLGFTVGAEIGVEKGLYSEVLCRANPEVKLFCVDAWTAYPAYREHVSQEKLDGFYETTKERLKGYNFELVRKFSVDAAKDFKNGSLDFVYIDGNHILEQVVADLSVWIPKVRRGGIISGHDYRQTKGPTLLHVVQALHAWTDAYRIRPWFVLGSKAMIPGEVRDHNRSWMWVRG